MLHKLWTAQVLLLTLGTLFAFCQGEVVQAAEPNDLKPFGSDFGCLHPILNLDTAEAVSASSFETSIFQEMVVPRVTDSKTRYYAGQKGAYEIEVSFAQKVEELCLGLSKYEITNILGKPQVITGSADLELGLSEPGPHWIYQIGYSSIPVVLWFSEGICKKAYHLGERHFTDGYTHRRKMAMWVETKGKGMTKAQLINRFGPEIHSIKIGNKEVELEPLKKPGFRIPVRYAFLVIYYLDGGKCYETLGSVVYVREKTNRSQGTPGKTQP